jgi:GMP synthase (glutamine-hydrolysing)
MAIIVTQHSDNCLAARLGAVLRDHGHRLDFIRPDRGEAFPTDLEEVDGVVSLGGPQNLDEDHPWMAGEMDLLRLAHEQRRPIVGICLGAQLLASALGGEVTKLEKPEVGMHPLSLAHGGMVDPIFAGVGWRTPMFHSHTRWISKLPADAALLASSPQCQTQAFCVGSSSYGFQFHFEAYRSTMRLWADQSPQHLEEAGVARADYDATCDAEYEAFARISDLLCLRLATLLVPQSVV